MFEVLAKMCNNVQTSVTLKVKMWSHLEMNENSVRTFFKLHKQLKIIITELIC